jgi:hypothetical protein
MGDSLLVKSCLVPEEPSFFPLYNVFPTKHCVIDIFQVSLDNGMVQCFDKRATSSNSTSGSKTIFTLHAHEKAVSSVSFCPVAPNVSY